MRAPVYTQKLNTSEKSNNIFSGGYGGGEDLVNIFVLYLTDIIVHIDYRHTLYINVYYCYKNVALITNTIYITWHKHNIQIELKKD